MLAGRYRLYRFGIEEAFAVAAVVLLCIGEQELGPPRLLALTLLVGACGGAALYLRYGFIYAAVASVGCLALIPFQLDLSARSSSRWRRWCAGRCVSWPAAAD